jgi:5,10-methylene-tetrahydrofolate dehydrogenase/methenyl tetrahydrofolate cyclohydrolase
MVIEPIFSHNDVRSEVVGRPLAALLANDGARVFSVDINDIQVYLYRCMRRITINIGL